MLLLKQRELSSVHAQLPTSVQGSVRDLVLLLLVFDIQYKPKLVLPKPVAPPLCRRGVEERPRERSGFPLFDGDDAVSPRRYVFYPWGHLTSRLLRNKGESYECRVTRRAHRFPPPLHGSWRWRLAHGEGPPIRRTSP